MQKAPKKRYHIRYDEAIADHMAFIDLKHHSLIRKTIKEQLEHEPARETTNRKPLTKPSVLDPAWELRFGPSNRFRVFYRTFEETLEVWVLAIGEKKGNRLYVAGKVFAL